MKKKKNRSQGEIIDELREIRAKLWHDCRGDVKKLHSDAKRIAKQLGMKYASPRKRKKKDAA